MARRDGTETTAFLGFDRPESNWFRMPNSWTDITAGINSLAELKVVEYILRHTWGYQEYGLKKHITIDEFVSGRKRQDGTRMDRGTGLSERAVYDGLRKAVEDGLIEEAVDDSDRGRVKKYYSLRMREDAASPRSAENPPQDLQPGVQSLHPPLQILLPRGAGSAPRTEKDTLERQLDSNLRKASAEEEHVDKLPAATQRTGDLLPLGEAIAHWQRQRRESHAGPPALAVTSTDPAPPPASSARTPITEPDRRRRGRPPGTSEERELLGAFLGDFASELGDEAPLSSTVTRALGIFTRAGVPRERWSDFLYQARAITKERSAQIRKRPTDPTKHFPAKVRMPYYLAILESLVGLRDEQGKKGLDPRNDQTG